MRQKSFAIGLWAATAALVPAAAGGAEPPPELIEATEQAATACRELGGTPSILPAYQTALDLNGDGREDFLTDLAGLQCKDAWSAFCGTAGCPVSAWLSEPGGGHVRFDLGYLQGHEIAGSGRLPVLRAAYHGTGCGNAAAEPEGCTRSWVFDSNAPETPPVDAADPPEPVAEAAPAPEPEPAPAPPPAPPPAPAPAVAIPAGEPPARGWTLRNVPGASPVALGMGTGRIASLAAFCLAGQPFLAVTFRDPPEPERLPLAFDFRGGAVQAEAAREATAGGAYVVALAGSPLAAGLAGRDREVAMSAGGQDEGILSLRGSTRSIRGALEGCIRF